MDITVRTNRCMTNSAKTFAGVTAISICAVWLFSQSTYGADKYPACKAASEKVDYGSGLSIPDSTRELIESYRRDWKSLCSPNGTRKLSLAEIFAKAKQIESDFKKIFDAFDEAILNEPNFDPRRSIAINELVSSRFPEFVPAFKGAYGDHEMFSPSLAAFRASAALGNTEDRIFFRNQISLEGDFPAYITKTWDYGGCTQFGEFDWDGTLKNIARIRKDVKTEAYLKQSSILEEGLFRELGANYDICTCGKKDAVLKDLLGVQKVLKKDPGFASHVPEVRKTIDSIQSGKIKINSEMEKHCSGG